MNSCWMFGAGGPFVEAVSRQFLWFLLPDILRFHWTFLLFDKSNPLIFQMCFYEDNLAYLCPNIINFNVVDFREHCSEEVIKFLLMLSVDLAQCHLHQSLLLTGVNVSLCFIHRSTRCADLAPAWRATPVSTQPPARRATPVPPQPPGG